MPENRQQSLSADEARKLHEEALVIDTQQPPIASGIVFTPKMKETLDELHKHGRTRAEAAGPLARALARDVATSDEAKKMYLDMWRKSGVTVACGTFSGTFKPSTAFESALAAISNAHTIVDACRDEMMLVKNNNDLERAHRERKRGIIIDFQETWPIGDDLDRVDTFHGFGLRMVQLTYNLQNLMGDGCTETQQGGLTYFGRALVQKLNELDILVDVSHCAEAVGFDAMDVSSAPVIVSHSSSKAVAYHDRGKTDELARAIAEQGGYFGVVAVPGFIRDTPGATVKDVVKQIEHLVDVCGIDHVGIGTDKAGPGPRTSSMVEFPESMPADLPSNFNWSGFRTQEHRQTPEYDIEGFKQLGDWPNITVALAEAGFNEEELRKLLGLNYQRVFKEVVG